MHRLSSDTLGFLEKLSSEVPLWNDGDLFDACHACAALYGNQIFRRIENQKKRWEAPVLLGIDYKILQQMEDRYPVLRDFIDLVDDRKRFIVKYREEEEFTRRLSRSSNENRDCHASMNRFSRMIQANTKKIRTRIDRMRPLRHVLGDMLGNLLFAYIEGKGKTPD
ncbi:MAG: hypothetical protein ACJKSS_02675 [Patescibacteria group bacterium UBA2103]